MELDSPSNNILLAGGDAPESTTAKLLETCPVGAESEDHAISSEVADATVRKPTPLQTSEGQLVRIKQEPDSPLFGSHTPEPATNSGTPEPPQSDIEIEEAIRAQLGPKLIEWPGAQEEAQETKPTTSLKKTNELKDAREPQKMKEEEEEDSMFVDALADFDTAGASNAEGEDLVFLGGSVPQYAWANIDDTSELAARIVEEAVDVALAAGQQVANILHTSASRETRVNVAHWVKEFGKSNRYMIKLNRKEH